MLFHPAPNPAPSTTRYLNFDLSLRLAAAASVVFSHAFGITEGHDRNEPFVRLLGPENILGIYGVYIFFITSGFLITASFHRSSLGDYALKRGFRIIPGLAVCVHRHHRGRPAGRLARRSAVGRAEGGRPLHRRNLLSSTRRTPGCPGSSSRQ
jgi:hypothetical protein